MPHWIGYLLSGAFGAILALSGVVFVFSNRVTAVEHDVKELKQRQIEDRERMQERVVLIADHMTRLLDVASKVLEQNTILITELRSARRDRA
jgi:hypothetical protein